jgi:hypothetical protein
MGRKVAGSTPAAVIVITLLEEPMPRPYPPTLLGVPEVKRFDIDASDRRRLARALGLTTLHPDLGGAIAHVIACLLATRSGSRDTTVGTTLAGLSQLCRPGRASDAVVARVADDRYGIDYTTHNRLQPLARAAMSGGTEARSALKAAARDRAAELRAHPRIAPDTEALRFFCGVLQTIFNASASPSMERTWLNCRRFALEVLSVAAVEHADFNAHPERLDEYLGTDVDPA